MTTPLLAPSKYYECVFNSLTTVTKRIPATSSFCFSSKNCYSELLKDASSIPVLPYRWSTILGYPLCLSTHWSHVRDSLTENYKNDLAWLITLRAVKVRDSLKSWGYSDSDLCASCNHKETIDHCFLNCLRAKRVWATLTPALSSLLPQPFVVNYQSVFFYSRFNASDKNNAIARYLVKTVLYALWHFRNKATFHNGTEDHRAIIRYICHDIATRLLVDFSRLPERKFCSLWCHDSICEVTGQRLTIQFSPS